MRYIATVIAALILSTASYAQGGRVLVSGLGHNSCGRYLAAVHGHPPGKGMSLNRPDGPFYDDHFRYAEIFQCSELVGNGRAQSNSE